MPKQTKAPKKAPKKTVPSASSRQAAPKVAPKKKTPSRVPILPTAAVSPLHYAGMLASTATRIYTTSRLTKEEAALEAKEILLACGIIIGEYDRFGRRYR